MIEEILSRQISLIIVILHNKYLFDMSRKKWSGRNWSVIICLTCSEEMWTVVYHLRKMNPLIEIYGRNSQATERFFSSFLLPTSNDLRLIHLLHEHRHSQWIERELRLVYFPLWVSTCSYFLLLSKLIKIVTNWFD